MTRAEKLTLALCLLVSMAACDVCFGTSVCAQRPSLGYAGQFIEHSTGKRVAGVHVSFVRRSGPRMEPDSITAVSDREGFFQLRGETFVSGAVVGDLIVQPPSPHRPYTVKGLRLGTSRVLGDGLYAGRLVVDPYYLFVGLARDRKTESIVTGAHVLLQRTGGERAEPDTISAVSDKDGRVFFILRMEGAGRMDAEAIVTAGGYPRPYRVPLHLFAQYVDRPAIDVNVLTLGRGLQYVVEVLRRGTRKHFPGTTVEFVRTGGIQVQPSSISVVLDTVGYTALKLEPLQDGVLTGDFVVRPPPPFRAETTRAVRLQTMDGDTLSLVRLGYGGLFFLRTRFVYRATGEPVEEGVQARVTRRSGNVIDPDDQLALLDSLGTLNYSAATGDFGSTLVDVELRLRAPHRPDSIRGMTVPSRLDSLPTDLGTVAVGRWLPWQGRVLDATNEAPIPNARVEFRRTSGVVIAPAVAVATTSPDGTFRFRAVPLRDGTVSGDISISFTSGFRDTTVSNVTLATSRDDTVRALSAIRVQRRP